MCVVTRMNGLTRFPLSLSSILALGEPAWWFNEVSTMVKIPNSSYIISKHYKYRMLRLNQGFD
jgi:hypothetical protein